jgi:hypothetical protein
VRRGWWRRNAVALAALPIVVGAAFVVAGRPLIDRWRDDDRADRTVALDEPFAWATGTFELRAVRVAPAPLDDDGHPFEPPPGTVVWRTAWRASGLDEYVGGGCVVQLVDGEGRRFGADPAELGRLDTANGCIPGSGADPGDFRFVRYFLLPADAQPTAVRFGSVLHDTVQITLD